MAYRRYRNRRRRRYSMKRRRGGRNRRKNLKRRTFPNKMYKRAVARTLHNMSKWLFKKGRSFKKKARRQGRKSRR